MVDDEIRKMNTVYDSVCVEKYCIMPDHIHFLICIYDRKNGRDELCSSACTPTISRIIKQFKGSISKQVGKPIWQKSFYDHAIRNQQDYDEIWHYIENNPLKYVLKINPNANG